MTIRRKLSLSFLMILLFLAVNLIVYFWGNYRRQATVETLRRAVSRQALISALDQNLNDIQKQITLLGQAPTEAASTGADPTEIAQFNRQLQKVETEITELRDLTEPEMRGNISSFAEVFGKLAASWRIFYQSFGVDQTRAITELVVTAEPLTQDVLEERLPELQRDENARVDAASVNFYEVARLTDRITILIFAISVIVGAGVAVLVPRQLTRGLTRLKEGAASIGSLRLDQRIDIRSNDELADLAAAFNDMSAKLSFSRDQLTRANELEKKKSEELRKAQDQLVVQQKLASLGSLTAGIAHEIKNPLNFVTNFAEVSVGLIDELQDSLRTQSPRLDPGELTNIHDILGDLQQNVGKIQEHGKRADGIVRNMLMHTRGRSDDRRMTDVNAMLGEYVKLAYHGMRAQNQDFNVAIQEDYDTSLEPISVVAHDLSRVFLNIANNACYAAYDKKKRLGDGFSPVVSVKTANLGPSVEIRIRDNGDGIPEASRDRVFEPFFTTKPTGAGTGLGLSMSYEIVVQQHHGQFRVESETGQFAEFIILLPKALP